MKNFDQKFEADADETDETSDETAHEKKPVIFIVTPITARKNYSKFINPDGIIFPTGKYDC